MIKDFFKKRFGKVLLFIITVSFILSSIGGVLFFSNKYNVIVVNGEKINYKKFANLLVKERELAYSNGEVDIDYLMSKEFTMRSLERITNSELLKSYLKDNNIQLKRDFVVQKIVESENFRENGEFSPSKYTEFLKNANLHEEEYIKLMEDYYSSMFLFNVFAIENNFDVETLKNIVDRNNAYKVVNLYEVDKKNLKSEDIAVSDEEVKKYYNANIVRFTHEEERKVDFVKIDITKSDREVSEKEISDYYNSNLNKYKIPETYNIYYLESNDKDSLNKIVKSKNKKELLASVKTNLNKSENEITIKDLPIDVLSYIFGKENVESVKLNTFSSVVEKNNIYMVFYLESKNESKTISLETAKNDIIKELQRNTSQEFIRSNYDKIQNIISGKKDIVEVAKALNINLESLGYITLNSGVSDLKNEKQIMFSSKLGEIKQSFKGDYIYLYSVSDIKKSYSDKFEDIKDELFNEVKKDKEDELYLKQVSVENKAQYKINRNIVVKKNDDKYDQFFVNELYTLKNGEITKVYVNDTKLYFADIIGDKSIDKNDANFINQESAKDAFDMQVNNSMNYYYLKHLREKYRIYINYNLLNYL